MRALLIGLGLVVTLTLGCSSSAQKPTPAPVPTPTAAPGNQTFATPTPVLVPIRHPPTPTPTPATVPTPMARLTVDEFINQIRANPKRYKRGDTLIVVGFLERKKYESSETKWFLEAPENWTIVLVLPRDTPNMVLESANPGDMVEMKMTIDITASSGVWAENASLIKVTKQK